MEDETKRHEQQYQEVRQKYSAQVEELNEQLDQARRVSRVFSVVACWLWEVPVMTRWSIFIVELSEECNFIYNLYFAE